MLIYIVVAILTGHGLIVAAQSMSSFGLEKSHPANPSWLKWWPADLGRSWLLNALKLGGTGVEKALGGLWLAAGLCIVAAALGSLGFIIPQEAWLTLALLGTAGALLMLLLYLHPFYIIGFLLDIAILVSLLWAKWPPELFAGA